MNLMMQWLFPFFWVYLPETGNVHEKLEALEAHMTVFSDTARQA